MDPALSRRALFRGVLSRTSTSAEEPTARLARIEAGCVEPLGVACRRCGEACDTDAIAFAPIGGGRNAPFLSADRCNGCGACAEVCPVSAITLADADTVALARGLAHLGANPR